MDFLKGLQAFDVEKVLESASKGLDAVDEFPDRSKPQKRTPEANVTAGAVGRARAAHAAWEGVDLEVGFLQHGRRQLQQHCIDSFETAPCERSAPFCSYPGNAALPPQPPSPVIHPLLFPTQAPEDRNLPILPKFTLC